jgi:hypothetical protein
MRPVTVSRAKDVSIGELSRRTGVNVETIRYGRAGESVLR